MLEVPLRQGSPSISAGGFRNRQEARRDESAGRAGTFAKSTKVPIVSIVSIVSTKTVLPQGGEKLSEFKWFLKYPGAVRQTMCGADLIERFFE